VELTAGSPTSQDQLGTYLALQAMSGCSVQWGAVCHPVLAWFLWPTISIQAKCLYRYWILHWIINTLNSNISGRWKRNMSGHKINTVFTLMKCHYSELRGHICNSFLLSSLLFWSWKVTPATNLRKCISASSILLSLLSVIVQISDQYERTGHVEIVVFICGLHNDDVNSSDCIALNDRMIKWIIN
jgi:hypothetical protein